MTDWTYAEFEQVRGRLVRRQRKQALGDCIRDGDTPN